MMLYHAAQEDNTERVTDEPLKIEEALNGKDREEWIKAMKSELSSLKSNDAWTLVDLLEGKKPVQSKWVFKVKRDADGKIDRYKARLVAKGFTQRFGVDYSETSSPVIRYSTLRLLLALAAELGLTIDHMDVTTAFLNGDLKEEVYMQQPNNFEVKGQEEKVCLLKKAIYGLKQSSRTWYETIDSVLEELDFCKSDLEPCVYYKYKGESIIIIALYVDDILIFRMKN